MEKNRVLVERLYKAENESKELKAALDLVQSENPSMDAKERKILELAKKNRELQVRVESLKNKAARAMQEVNTMKATGPSQSDLEEQLERQLEAESKNEGAQQQKKIKDLEKRILKIRAERDLAKTELEKAHKVIEKEVGPGKNIDALLAEGDGWKGRQEKIQILKEKLKKAKAQFGDGVSTVSFTTENTLMSGTKTHASKTIEKIENNRMKENEALKEELMKANDLMEQLEMKCKAAVARKKVVEKELKTQKDTFQSKFKVLLDKTENDDKLITVLKTELARLESGKKGSGLSSKLKQTEGQKDEAYWLKNEVTKLKNEVAVLETELSMKERKVEELLEQTVGDVDERLEEKEFKIKQMEDEIDTL